MFGHYLVNRIKYDGPTGEQALDLEIRRDARTQRDAWAPSTLRAYRAAWRTFTGWCEREGLTANANRLNSPFSNGGRRALQQRKPATSAPGSRRLSDAACHHIRTTYDQTRPKEDNHWRRQGRRSASDHGRNYAWERSRTS